jgi:transcription antitermination factor NusG
MQELRWYALKVKPQHESVVYAGLTYTSIEGFHPTCKAKRKWSDRVKIIDVPLFEGYVFGRFIFENRVPILRIPGVISVVGFSGHPAPIPDEELKVIQRITASGLAVKPWPFLKVGQAVRIERGPLRGVEGILAAEKDVWRMVVGIQMLQRAVSVVVDKDDLTVISSLALRC